MSYFWREGGDCCTFHTFYSGMAVSDIKILFFFKMFLYNKSNEIDKELSV